MTYGIEKLTNAERLAWAQYARPAAYSRHLYEISQGRYANAQERAERELKFIDAIIERDGVLPELEPA